MERSVQIEFTGAELQALAGLLDAGVRQVGLRGVKEAAVLLAKIEAAANAPAPSAEPPQE